MGQSLKLVNPPKRFGNLNVNVPKIFDKKGLKYAIKSNDF